MKLKNAIGLIANKLFDWKTVFNPITRKLYPELYEYHGGVITIKIGDRGLGKTGNIIAFMQDFQSQYPSLKRKG